MVSVHILCFNVCRHSCHSFSVYLLFNPVLFSPLFLIFPFQHSWRPFLLPTIPTSFPFCQSPFFVPVLASLLPQPQPSAVTRHFLTASAWLCQVVSLCCSTVAMVRLAVYARVCVCVCVWVCVCVCVWERVATYTHVGVNDISESCVEECVLLRMCGFTHTNFGVKCGLR